MSDSTFLYHCTSSESLGKILETRMFLPSFCLERADYLEQPFDFAFAMVCFADLLKEELNPHLYRFNKDAYIRMSKDWAKKNGLSNVIYYNRSSILAKVFRRWLEGIIERSRQHNNKYDVDVLMSSYMMAFFKQYEGHYWDRNINGWSKDKVQFYIEREWRYIPLVEHEEAFFLEKKQFIDNKLLTEKRNELINNGYVLRFVWDDIEEIGIKDKQEKDNFQRILREQFNIDNIIDCEKIKWI